MVYTDFDRGSHRYSTSQSRSREQIDLSQIGTALYLRVSHNTIGHDDCDKLTFFIQNDLRPRTG
jgi:hypothetical protein